MSEGEDVKPVPTAQGFVRAVCAALTISTAVMPPLADSARAQVMVSGDAGSRHVAMGVGKSVIVDLPQDASEIFVGNPKVANAVVRSARKLYIIGIDNGQTSIFALDAQGRQIASLDISIGRDVGELQQILRTALPTSSIVARTINDTVILTGNVDSAEEAQRAGDIAKGFVKQAATNGGEGSVINSLVIRGRDQVMLKVTIAEVRRDIAKQLGITAATWGSFTLDNSFPVNTTLTNTALTLKNPANTLSATLKAYERYGVSRILAEPNVSAISGESAKFTVGGQIPIPSSPVCTTTGTQSNCSAGGATFKDYGITLNFAPVVLSEGRILLHVATEVTEIDTQNSAVIQGVSVPGLLTRKNETTIELPSGGSIASAGLLQTTTRAVINGLPGLMNLPILGTLFRSRDFQKQETELMIVVTPYVIKAVRSSEISRPDDGFADSSDPQAWLLGRMNRLYASPGNPQAVQNYRGRVGFIQD